MRSPFADRLEKYARELRAAERATTRTITRSARAAPDRRMVDYLKRIDQAQWQMLANLGRRDVASAERSLTALRTAQQRMLPSVSRLPQLARAGALAPAVADHPQADEMLAGLRAHLRAEGATPARARATVAAIAALDPKNIARDLRAQALAWTGRLDVLAERQLTVEAGGAMAMAVARFNQAVATPPTVKSTPGAYVEFATRELASDERALHQALRSGDPFVTWGYAVDLRRHAARRLFAGSLAHAALLALARRDAPDDDELGGQALAVGTLIRRQLAAMTVGHAIEWHSMWGREGAGFAAWVAAATATSGGSGYRAPRAVAVSTLARQPQRADGEERTVTGRITAVEIAHVRRKAISRATLSDGNREVTLVLPYIKIDSGGLVPGAWARVSGTWRASSTEAGGAPALEVHRRPLARLGQTHWSERMLSETDHLFTPVSHGLAAEWSWEPGADGAGNPLRFGTWFARKGA